MRGGVRVVVAPDEVDGYGVGVAQGAVGDAVAAVLGGGGPGRDTDAAAGCDGGEPVVDVVGVLDGRTGVFGPQVQGGGAGAAVHHQGAPPGLLQADAAALGPRVVGGEGEVAAFVADEGVGEAAGVDGGADYGEVAEALGEATGGGDGAAGAMQQPHAEDPLQREQGAGYGCLGDAQLDRGVGEAARVDDRDQTTQVPSGGRRGPGVFAVFRYGVGGVTDAR